MRLAARCNPFGGGGSPMHFVLDDRVAALDGMHGRRRATWRIDEPLRGLRDNEASVATGSEQTKRRTARVRLGTLASMSEQSAAKAGVLDDGGHLNLRLDAGLAVAGHRRVAGQAAVGFELAGLARGAVDAAGEIVLTLGAGEVEVAVGHDDILGEDGGGGGSRGESGGSGEQSSLDHGMSPLRWSRLRGW
ncbi:hypothetical protein NOVOSPHI9U_50328 [Novosphingobium sp. 9U]|nr:hypothetical protein NOVOSPHI9U_50328 [Novosphingobium sp. 9U]